MQIIGLSDNQIAVISRTKSTVLPVISENIFEYIGDLNNYGFIKSVVDEFQPDLVFHLAANKERSRSIDIVRTAIDDNLISSLNLFQSLVGLKNLKSIITLGTIDEYGAASSPYLETASEMPNTAYGLSKLFVSDLALFFYRTQNLPITIIRPSLAYGPWQGTEMFIPSLLKSLLNGLDYKMTLGAQKRDFIYVSDLIEVILKLSVSGKGQGEIYNVGSGESIALSEVARLIAQKIGKYDNLKIGYLEYRKDEMMEYNVPISKISNLINWYPKISLDMGIDLVLEHYRTSINEE